MRFVPLFAATILATAIPVTAQVSVPYKAVGTEPFWSATIDAREIVFQPMEGRPTRVTRPRPIVGINGELYRTPRLTLDITHVRCSDGMSDRSYRDTVRVTIGRQIYKGCGGGIVSEGQASAIDGNWRVERVLGAPVVRGASVTIAFTGERVSGNTGCNSFNGTFRMERGRVTAGPLMTTRRACAGRAAQQQEAALIRILGKRLSVTTNRAGKLVLTAPNGETLLLVRGR